MVGYVKVITVPHWSGFFTLSCATGATTKASLVRGGKEKMFAIVQTGGKQYKVSVGDQITVEKLERNVGDKIKLDVLMLADGEVVKAGNPVLSDAVCEAEIVEHGKGDKIIVFKYKAKKNERKKQGHRQPYTKIKITAIK